MNTNLYQTNLDFLLTHSRIACADERNLEKLKAPEKDWELNLEKVRQNGFEKNSIRFHSARDPQREALRQVDSIVEGDKRHLVFLGAGVGYPLAEAIGRSGVESLLLMETDPEVLFYCLSFMDFSLVQKDFYVYFCPSPEMDSLELILPFFQNKNLDKFGIYHHRPSFQLPGSKFKNLERQLGAIMHKRAINQATIIKFQGLWNKNIALNVKPLVRGKTLNELIGVLKGKFRHIVLCGAGPSLAESFSDMRKYRDRYFLVCADTALIPLLKNDLLPDLVISADPQWLNHYFAMTPRAAECLWLMDPVVSYQTSHYLKHIGAPMFWWDNPFYLDLLIRNFESRGEIAHGGSVSTNGFDLALKLDPESVILVGQDLSFSHKNAHVKGAVLESRVFFKNDRFGGFEMHNLRQMKSLPPRKVERCIVPGEVVYTNDKMRVFIDWFENQATVNGAVSKTRFYNATARGVFLRGFAHNSFSEILESSPAETPVKTWREQLPAQPGEVGGHALKTPVDTAKLVGIQRDCSRLQVLYQKNMQLVKKSMSTRNPNQVNEINRELGKNDAQIKKFDEVNRILSINAQGAILKITEQGDESENSAYLFYRAMYLSARKTGYFFKKMIHTMD